jgi:hypothetical protein
MPEPTASSARAGATPQSMPVLSCSLHLHSAFTQQVYKRVWDRLKADLYVVTVRTRVSGMDEAARVMESFITEEFTKARKDLDGELERTDILIDSVKLAETPNYTHPLQTKAEYSTPRAKEYLDLLMKLDELLKRYDVLWLTGVIEPQARHQRSQMWKRRLTKIANRIRELGNQTRAGMARQQGERALSPTNGAASTSTELSPNAQNEDDEGSAEDAPVLEASDVNRTTGAAASAIEEVPLALDAASTSVVEEPRVTEESRAGRSLEPLAAAAS